MKNNDSDLYRQIMLKKLYQLDYQHYQKENSRKHINACLKNKYLVEAFCLAIQYIEKNITLMIDKKCNLNRILEDKINFRNVFTILESMDIINGAFCSKFIKLNTYRDKFAHEIIKREKYLDKYFKNKELQNLPIECMNISDQLLAEHALKLLKQKEDSNYKKKIFSEIISIVIDRIKLKEIKLPDLSKNERDKLISDEFKTILENK